MNDILNKESFSIIRFNAELEYSSQRISGNVNQKIKTQAYTNAGLEVTFEDFNEDAKWTNLSDSEYPKNWESIEAGAYWYK